MQFHNSFEQLPKEFYADAFPAAFSRPQLLKFNKELSEQLGLNLGSLPESDLVDILLCKQKVIGSRPIAFAYAGHQFGHFVPLLGDGRAILLGEVLDPNGRRFDIQLKGAGQTVFSRNGDGRAALGPVLREYIVSEAMHKLGVPTTRALAAISTGDIVYRESPLPGALLVRVASGHIRIGTFEYIAAKGDLLGLQALLDYSIDRHYPEIKGEVNAALLFLKKVASAQINLVAHWMSIGFIHGVMNTDNMTISGETLDYGPCAFMDQFSFDQVFSYIDRQGRYAYMNQGSIVHWNLSRLAECLIPLVHKDQKIAIELLKNELDAIPKIFELELNQRMSKKLGLLNYQSEDKNLIESWLNYLQEEQLDFTLSFRMLSSSLDNNPSTDVPKAKNAYKSFERAWHLRLKNQAHDLATIKNNMDKVNPLFIPRNHQIERAIHNAIEGDLSTFNELNQVLSRPFDETLENSQLSSYKNPPLPEEKILSTFCGT